MVQYLFILGNSTSLAKAELFSILEKKLIKYSLLSETSEVVHLSCEAELDFDDIIKTCGGVVKIAGVFKTFESSELIEKLAFEVEKNGDHTTFGISLYGVNFHINPEQISKGIKVLLKERGIGSRFVLPKNNRLSSVVVTKQKIKEFVLYSAEKIIVAKTLCVQNFEDWSKRDYERPAALPKIGMLPPKVARMMLNLTHGDGTTHLLLDPFCGSGTILQEAMALGFKCSGSDISDSVIKSARENLDWFKQEYDIKTDYTLNVSDATKLQFVKDQTVDVIVTEPYLGPIWEIETGEGKTGYQSNQKKLSIAYLNNIIFSLEGLYTGCLREFHRVLKKNSELVIAIPSFYFDNKEYFVKKVVDNFSRLGYIIKAGPLPYYRPKAVVRRNIYVLKMNN